MYKILNLRCTNQKYPVNRGPRCIAQPVQEPEHQRHLQNRGLYVFKDYHLQA